VPQGQRLLLQVASVVVKDVPFALLRAIAELTDEALRRDWPTCSPPKFLHETGLYPDLDTLIQAALPTLHV